MAAGKRRDVGNKSTCCRSVLCTRAVRHRGALRVRGLSEGFWLIVGLVADCRFRGDLADCRFEGVWLIVGLLRIWRIVGLRGFG
jgi:hypothetical protein